MPQIQNKPFFLPLDCTETDRGSTTVGAESHSTTDPVARRSEMACATKSLYRMAERLLVKERKGTLFKCLVVLALER